MKRIMIATALLAAMTGSALATNVCLATQKLNQDITATKNKLDICYSASVNSNADMLDLTCKQAVEMVKNNEIDAKKVMQDLILAAFDTSRQEETKCAIYNLELFNVTFANVGKTMREVADYAKAKGMVK